MKITLKNLLYFVTFQIGLIPLLVFAAFDDVQMNTGAQFGVTVGSTAYTFDIGNNSAEESITVNADSIDVTGAGGSVLTITSTDKLTWTGGAPMAATSECNSGNSVLQLSSGGSTTVTPSAMTCTVPSGGGGGGGGGGGTTAVAPSTTSTTVTAPVTPVTQVAQAPAPTPAVPATTPAVVVAQPSPVVQLVSPVFNEDLQLGSRGDDVNRLQELFAQDKEIYPDGLITGYYGQLTAAAVRKFQAKHGISQVGRVGPQTRAKLNEVFGSAAPAAQPSPVAQLVSPVFNSDLVRGVKNDDVKRLQELLAQDKEIYPEGLTTGFFGPATERAVRKFQAKHGISQVGRVGPQTRAKLNEVFGTQQPSNTPAVDNSAVEEAQRAALQKQLDDLQKQLQDLLKSTQ